MCISLTEILQRNSNEPCLVRTGLKITDLWRFKCLRSTEVWSFLNQKIFDQPWPISMNEETRQSSIKIRLPDAKSESKWVMILALRWQSSRLISCNLPSWDTEPFKSGHNHYQNMNENQITFISQSSRTWTERTVRSHCMTLSKW